MNEKTIVPNIEDVRELIDSVDREIVMLLKQRSRLVELVVAAKKESGMSVHQPDRFAQMMQRLKTIAKEEDLDEQLVTEVWDSIHESSKRQQNAKLQ